MSVWYLWIIAEFQDLLLKLSAQGDFPTEQVTRFWSKTVSKIDRVANQHLGTWKAVSEIMFIQSMSEHACITKCNAHVVLDPNKSWSKLATYQLGNPDTSF